MQSAAQGGLYCLFIFPGYGYELSQHSAYMLFYLRLVILPLKKLLDAMLVALVIIFHLIEHIKAGVCCLKLCRSLIIFLLPFIYAGGQFFYPCCFFIA